MIADIVKIYGDRLDVIRQGRPTWERLEELGYEYRGAETRRLGTEPYVLSIWTRGDRLVRSKHFLRQGMMEIAAFDDEGYLWPLYKALEEDDVAKW